MFHCSVYARCTFISCISSHVFSKKKYEGIAFEVPPFCDAFKQSTPRGNCPHPQSRRHLHVRQIIRRLPLPSQGNGKIPFRFWEGTIRQSFKFWSSEEKDLCGFSWQWSLPVPYPAPYPAQRCVLGSVANSMDGMKKSESSAQRTLKNPCTAEKYPKEWAPSICSGTLINCI